MVLDKITHKNIFLRILKDIFTNHSIGPFLGFKGGTAALFFYDLDRFSVDLDFDLLEETKEDEVFDKVKKILENYGALKEAEKKRFNLFYVLSYADKAVGGRNIKVEINRRDFGSKYEVKHYIGIPMKVMTREDMAAHKLCAMYERINKTTRDIYDVYFFLKNNWPVNKQIIVNRAGMSYEEFLQKSIMALERSSNRDILSGLGELLDEKQKIWAKAKLRDETIFLLKLALDGEKDASRA